MESESDQAARNEKALNRALYYITARMRTESEIRRRLKKSETDDAAIDYALAKLRAYGYVDDAQFAADFVADKSRSLSSRRIQGKLLHLGVSPDDARQAVGAVDPDAEYAAALAAGQKALRSLSGDKTKEKLINRLLYRGFDYDTIRQVIRELLQQETED